MPAAGGAIGMLGETRNTSATTPFLYQGNEWGMLTMRIDDTQVLQERKRSLAVHVDLQGVDAVCEQKTHLVPLQGGVSTPGGVVCCIIHA